MGKICVYCGSEYPKTKDHIPPVNLFPRPRPNNLITVPACRKCNGDAAKDDEYFRDTLCVNRAVQGSPAADEIRSVFKRSLARPEAAGLRSLFESSLKLVDIRTPSGLLIARAPACDVELQRILAAVARYVRGLFFHETHRILDTESDVIVWSNDTLRFPSQSQEITDKLTRTVQTALRHIPSKAIGNGVFSYAFCAFEDDPLLFAWALTFFESVSFMAITGLPTGEERPAI